MDKLQKQLKQLLDENGIFDTGRSKMLRKEMLDCPYKAGLPAGKHEAQYPEGNKAATA